MTMYEDSLNWAMRMIAEREQLKNKIEELEKQLKEKNENSRQIQGIGWKTANS